MITVNGWCAGGKGGGWVGQRGGGDECSANGGDGERLLSKLPPTVGFELAFNGKSHPRDQLNAS